jgi:hypothetical protein
MKMRIAVIVPAYNEENSIGNVVRSIRQLGEGYDAVVINDNSNDRTPHVAEEAGAIVIGLPCNLGIGGAVQTGYKYALTNGYDACVQADGDGQHPTREIPKLLKPLMDGGYDLVIGSRFVIDTNYDISFMRNVGIKIISLFLQIFTGIRVKDPTSGFRAINKKALELFAREYPQDYPEPESLVFAHKLRFKVKEVPMEMKNRMFGISSITPLKSGYYMVKVLLAMFIDLFKKP